MAGAYEGDRLAGLGGEEQLRDVEEERAPFYCPDCNAPVVQRGDRDYPKYHCVVTV
jgi:hypothetical protein